MATTQETSMAESIQSRVEPQLQNILDEIQDHLPDRRQVQGTLSWLVVGLALFILTLVVFTIGSVTLTAGAVLLPIAIPFFLFWSAILVPLGAIFGLMLVVATTGLATVSAVVWFYRYLNGEEPIYYDHVDAARSCIAGKAHEVKVWALEHVPHIQQDALST